MNQEVRIKAKARGVKLWQIAQHLGISEPTITRWLRVELEPERKAQMLEAIDTLAAQQQEAYHGA